MATVVPIGPMTLRSRDFVDAIADEVAFGVDVAVESWMAEIDRALNRSDLTTLGRMNAAKEILTHYKNLTGKKVLQPRRPWVPED